MSGHSSFEGGELTLSGRRDTFEREGITWFAVQETVLDSTINDSSQSQLLKYLGGPISRQLAPSGS